MGWPADLTWYKLLNDWQTIITGGLAIFAAIIGGGITYRAGVVQANETRESAKRQIAAMNRKDRLQARVIAVGISPELLQLERAHGKAQQVIRHLPASISDFAIGRKIAESIREARIEIPPILSRIVDQLYILGEPAGPTVLQLVSGTLQFNHLIEKLMQQVSENPNSFGPPKHQKDLSAQLRLIGHLIAEAQQEIEPLHDEITRPPHRRARCPLTLNYAMRLH
jgi:hypothetical protein